MFASLFSDESVLRELYCALRGVSLPDNIPIEINTLENVLYMDFINDISFEIGGKLVVLIEHQSTINPNIALRLLFYICRILEKKTESSNLYTTKQLKIPFPEFYVLYNGIAPFPDNEIIRLSDLFENPANGDTPPQIHPLLQLEVKIININEGRNAEMVNRCKKLMEYSFFVEKVRKYIKDGYSLEEAMKKTIKYCATHDILKEYLEIHGSEVMNMLEDWNMEDAKKFWREEAREEGLVEGLEQGRAQGRIQGIEQGIEQGREQGRQEERQRFYALLEKMGIPIEQVKEQLSNT
jgi:predicted transposase/invertase (TIGR01784 family)